ncbi:MAG: hypothetical protein IPM81_13740 [Saprospirales bacterium]|nr:hypothetical protein [Saprospirales bacterium]
MFKITQLLLCLFGTAVPAFAQNAWHLNLPGAPLSNTFCGLGFEGDRYLVHTHASIYELDHLGAVTGNIRLANGPLLWTSVVKRTTVPDGHPYFLVARRPVSQSPTYSLAEYRPGTGFVNEQQVPDSLGSISGQRPLLVDLPDGSFLAIGRKFYRKMTYSPATGFSQVWARPLGMAATAVLPFNNTLILTDAAGYVTALDENGNLLWTKHHGIAFRGIAAAPVGFIACGQTSGGKATVIRLDANGDEIWRKETTDNDYFAIVAAAAGTFSVTGQSTAGSIVLASLSSAGEVLWKKDYGLGTGIRLLEAPGGGFVLAAQGIAPSGLRLINTDDRGQTPPLENAQISERRISTSAIQATLLPSAALFFDGSGASFISIPDSAATMLSFAPWFGGIVAQGDLYVAAANYPGFYTDFRTGLANGSPRDFRQVWAASRDAINHLRFDFGADKTLDDPVPFDLLTWPGKGNPYLRHNLDFTPVETASGLFPAPFVDANNDGIYNVYDGDYPRIKGDIMAWWALTDSTLHNQSYGRVMGLDLQVSAYAYDCPQTGSVERSVFADFEIVNRFQTDYQGTYMGFFTDVDLGCQEDDLLGSLPAEDAYYVYNQDAVDSNCVANIHGFGANIPMQSIALLNRRLDHFMYYQSPIAGTPLPATTDPALPSEFYRLLQGFWRDGTPLTTGGSGYNPASTDTVRYAFPGNPADSQGWSMCTAPQPYADRRLLGSHGPFAFAAGDTFLVQVAFTFHPDIPHPCPDISGQVKANIAQIRQWKNAGTLDNGVDLGQVVVIAPGQTIQLQASVPGALSYLWSTGETTASISVSGPGQYTVTVTAPTGCRLEENVLVQLGSGAGVPAAAIPWSVQPNPARAFTLVTCAGCAENASYQAVLRNAQGMLLQQAAGAGKAFRLDLSSFPAGFYWLELWQGGQFLGNKKLVLVGY